MTDKILSMAGLARRAGKISSGGTLCTDAVRKGIAKLVILAADASENTKKSIRDSCLTRKIPVVEYADTESLGKCVGCGERAVISVNDKNFAEAILNIYNQSFR